MQGYADQGGGGVNFVYSKHALEEMVRRRIPRDMADEVLRKPEQVVDEHSLRKCYQSRVYCEEGELFLLRVIVDVNTEPGVVITLYRTSKISKYWSAP